MFPRYHLFIHPKSNFVTLFIKNLMLLAIDGQYTVIPRQNKNNCKNVVTLFIKNLMLLLLAIDGQYTMICDPPSEYIP